MRYFFVGLLLLTSPVSVWAHDKDDHYDRISLSASASEEVQQDELQASLYTMSENDDARASANAVSARIQKALDRLADESEITVQTGSFSTHPVYHKQQIVGWRSRQSLLLKSRNAARLSQLLGKLQTHVQVESIRYGVSDKNRTRAEDELIRQAINHFKARAQLISKQMGRDNYRLVNMNVSTSQRGPIMRQAAVMSARVESHAPPAIKTGTQRIQVNVNGTIEVQLKQ